MLSVVEFLRDAPDEEWKDRAACRGVDPALFFPERGEPTEETKAVCAHCEVREACLEYALTHYEKHGVWGGVSERERRRLRKERERPRVYTVGHGTRRGYELHRELGEEPCLLCRAFRSAEVARVSQNRNPGGFAAAGERGALFEMGRRHRMLAELDEEEAAEA